MASESVLKMVARICHVRVDDARQFIRDAAAATGVSEETIRKKIRKGVIHPKSLRRMGAPVRRERRCG